MILHFICILGNDSAYWYFYGTRLYREDYKSKLKKEDSVWQVICFTQEDWFQLAKKFKKSTNKAEKQLYCTLTENFLPELPRLFQEKEKLARKKLLEKPRKSSRLQKLVCIEEMSSFHIRYIKIVIFLCMFLLCVTTKFSKTQWFFCRKMRL